MPPDGRLATCKLLSRDPERYEDAAVTGIRRMLGLHTGETVPAEQIAVVKMGTTVATNALLERKGEPTVLVVTEGFRDALRIAYQNRPRLFDHRILLPEALYDRVIEVPERMAAHGATVCPLDLPAATAALHSAYRDGFRSAAVVFMHAYRYPAHEQAVAQAARDSRAHPTVAHLDIVASPPRDRVRYRAGHRPRHPTELMSPAG